MRHDCGSATSKASGRAHRLAAPLRALADATIVRSTIDLGRNLGLGVVAEGIESQEVWDALRADGCSLAQGYFISRPASAEYLKPILEERALRIRDGVAKAS